MGGPLLQNLAILSLRDISIGFRNQKKNLMRLYHSLQRLSNFSMIQYNAMPRKILSNDLHFNGHNWRWIQISNTTISPAWLTASHIQFGQNKFWYLCEMKV